MKRSATLPTPAIPAVAALGTNGRLPAVVAQAGLTPAQADGIACIRCGSDDGPMTPVGTRDGIQVFACTPACPITDGRPEGPWDVDRIVAALPEVMQQAFPQEYTPELNTQVVKEIGSALASIGPVQVAKGAIRTALHARLDGLTTNPQDVSEELHQQVIDDQAEHLARVTGFPLEEARANEAFTTANYAIRQALSLSPDRARTAFALRSMLNMLIDEAGA
ncbi:hypothetical protein [Streptomyces sp. AC512_CC834]|uniref:hypothetical protein n=1 Tax=Streptomyces sp. AC512_CC834 TaxID=2823691 RepID=UPI001C2537A4|nr:hypothetical protein [Streptomyces sp. AC512_CC834]